MSRPTIADMDVTKAGWLATLNSNFAIVIDTPIPLYLAADMTALDTNNPAKYTDCFAILQTDSRLYKSDGTSWLLYDAKLDFIADMNPGVSTIADIRTAYNALLADMKTKDMMFVS